MAFFTMADFATKVIRTRNTDPATNPEPIQKGTLVLSSDLSSVSVCTVAGHLGGDSFEVQYTAGSNLVIIPNNILVWSGLKLFSPQFPAGVAITSKTANFREYTIASNATVTRKEFSNFCYLRTLKITDFSNFNLRTTPAGADMNLIRNEGSYYVVTATSNLPETGTGHFVDVLQSGLFLVQISRANNATQRIYHRRSADAGATWSAWFEVLTSNITWVAATLQNGYTNNSGHTVRYALNGNLLYVQGGVNTPSGTAASGSTIFIVPTAMQPVRETFTAIYGAGSGATSFPVLRASLQTNGAFVNSFAATVGLLYLDCVIVLK